MNQKQYWQFKKYNDYFKNIQTNFLANVKLKNLAVFLNNFLNLLSKRFNFTIRQKRLYCICNETKGEQHERKGQGTSPVS